ncbi:MAG: hypothetical protein IKD35_00595 [Clostridia bacterium]|nr:hypothetical protein [Clostridia bacterium]
MLSALKVAFLFIGTSIGAGFSTGREIALFFGDTSPWCVALASVFIAIICAVFLLAGKYDLIPQNIAVKVATFFAGAVSLVSMLAGSEKIMSDLTGVSLIGLVMIILGAVVVIMGIEKIKWANTILIPLLITMMIVIYIRIGAPVHNGSLSILKPIHYSGLDVLLAGMVLSKEGKKLSGKQIFGCVSAICIFMFGILFVLQNIVLCDEMHSSMPVLAISTEVNMRAVSGVLISSAIFTTLIGALETVWFYTADFLSSSKRLQPLSTSKNKCYLVLAILLVFYPISFLGFEKIVDTFYPFVSICGIALTIFITVKVIIFFVGKGHPNFSKIKRPVTLRQGVKKQCKGQIDIKENQSKSSSSSVSSSSLSSGFKMSSKGERLDSSSGSSSPFR